MTLHIHNISAHYTPDTPILRDITLDVAPGHVTSILGASGSGKTTLFRVLAGLHTPTTGTIRLDSAQETIDLTHLPAQQRRVGLVPQDGALFPHLSVAQNIAYGLRDVSARAATSHPVVREYAALVGLSGLEDRLPHQLSGGQQQRVALARALAPRPAFVLLDEPFSSLDPELRQHLRGELLTILRTQGVPVILVTHDPYEALSSTDVIALLRGGRLEHVGSPHELYTAPHSTWAARLLGKASFLPASFDGLTAHTALGHLDLASPPPEGATHVLIRPEHLTLTHVHEAATSPTCPGAAATVGSIQYYGHATLLELHLDPSPTMGGPAASVLVRVTPTSAPLRIGEQCFISVNSPVHALIDN